MQKFEVQKMGDRGWALFIDGALSICPYTPPAAIPGAVAGGFQIVQAPCCTKCPLASISESIPPGGNEPTLVYKLLCTNPHHVLEVSEMVPKEKNSAIIKPLL